ncbi:MAG: zinc-binding dehydrogenase [Pseudomonadota bacterium]
MKVVAFHQHGDVEQLAIEDWPIPEPGDGEILIRVRAISFNGFDPMILQKTTGLKTPLPMVPCGDGAGEISALGPGVSRDWKVGDRVSVLPYGNFGMMGETAVGLAREYAVIPQDNLVLMPDAVSFEEAAAIPVAYGTAFRMMNVRGKIENGERVFILGAAGGVGACCVQLAKLAGAEVIAASSDDWKLEKLRALGADHLINTKNDDFVKVIRNTFGKPRFDTNEGGVDVVINYIGGDTWAKSLRVLKRHGRMLTCGASAGYDPQTDIRYIWSFEQSIIGSDGWTKEDQKTLLEMCASGTLKPALHAVRPIDGFKTAMQEMVDRQVFGKSIITLHDE